MIKKVFMSRPWKFDIEFQKKLLFEHHCSIGNNLPHLVGDAAPLWWKATLGYHWNLYILPIQNYIESWRERENTYDSYREHGRPFNVLYYPTGIFDEPATRDDKDEGDYEKAQVEYARALQLGLYPFLTHPFPAPGIPRKEWIVPVRAGFRLSLYEDPALLKKYKKELDHVLDKCCYLIDKDFEEGFDYGEIGSRIRAVGDNWPGYRLPWFLLNDESELPNFFRENSAGVYDRLTENGEAFMEGCL